MRCSCSVPFRQKPPFFSSERISQYSETTNLTNFINKSAFIQRITIDKMENTMNKTELIVELTKYNIEFPKEALVAELRTLYAEKIGKQKQQQVVKSNRMQTIKKIPIKVN